MVSALVASVQYPNRLLADARCEKGLITPDFFYPLPRQHLHAIPPARMSTVLRTNASTA